MNTQQLNNDLSTDVNALEICLPHPSFSKLAAFGCDCLGVTDRSCWRAWLTQEGFIVTCESCDPYDICAQDFGFDLKAVAAFFEDVARDELADNSPDYVSFEKLVGKVEDGSLTFKKFKRTIALW